MVQGSAVATHLPEISFWRPVLKMRKAKITTFLILVVIVSVAFLSSVWIDTSTFLIQNPTNKTMIISETHKSTPQRIEFPLECSTGNQTQTCPTNYPTTYQNEDSNRVCPDYFRWIHEDLRPWRTTGITRDMVERANATATFRLVIVDGKAYVEKYRTSIQTRDVFTIWGILQLLRRYPGKLPDLELMFNTEDRPVVKSRDYRGPNSRGPPPVFRYCGDKWTMDIVFPDWSFWGWAEINIKPWHSILKDIEEGNKRRKWMDREPYAYWKGNPFVDDTRKDLLKCNVSEQQDWNARLYIQDWIQESEQGFKQSDVANQCTYRYKIYIEGYAWSVSEKYILACDSVTLLVKPKFYDFFIRSLQPVHHYWPIRDDDKCKSIKFAVDWGNSHKKKAQEIGQAASRFMQEELKMDNVYDYMYHLLNEYAKLLRYKPSVPDGAVELCSEAMACPASGLERKFKMESLVMGPSISSPCTLPPPYPPNALATFIKRKINSLNQVEKWENGYWEKSQ
ncbi:hypothetical protein SLA2020_401130 [Shorea laevis]